MKRKLLILLAFFALLLEMSSCRMRYPSGAGYRENTPSTRTRRHYGAKKTINPRKHMWGPKRFGPRPYNHRGRYRQ